MNSKSKESIKNYVFSLEQLELMKHCIGFGRSKVTGTKYRKMSAYRNYFTTSDNSPILDELVEQGLMEKRDFQNGVGENPKCYHCTKQGFEFLSQITEIQIIEMR